MPHGSRKASAHKDLARLLRRSIDFIKSSNVRLICWAPTFWCDEFPAVIFLSILRLEKYSSSSLRRYSPPISFFTAQMSRPVWQLPMLFNSKYYVSASVLSLLGKTVAQLAWSSINLMKYPAPPIDKSINGTTSICVYEIEQSWGTLSRTTLRYRYPVCSTHYISWAI